MYHQLLPSQKKKKVRRKLSFKVKHRLDKAAQNFINEHCALRDGQEVETKPGARGTTGFFMKERRGTPLCPWEVKLRIQNAELGL